jgi:transposase
LASRASANDICEDLGPPEGSPRGAGWFLSLAGSRTGWTEAPRRRSGTWTGKRCVTSSAPIRQFPYESDSGPFGINHNLSSQVSPSACRPALDRQGPEIARGLFGRGTSGIGSAVKERQPEPAWVHRFNASGPDGLIDNWTEGPKPRLSAEQVAQFAQIVGAGPDRHVDGVVRLRRIDLKRVIAERFGVDFHPRYVGKLLQKVGLSHISVRPRHPVQDERTVEAFKNLWPAPSARGFVEIGC